MSRHLVVASALAAALLVPAASSAASEHCRPRPGEHQLARSAQAVVFEHTVRRHQVFPRQTLTGCSRRSGRRRVLDVLQRESEIEIDPTKLVGVHLSGTRVAYVRTFLDPGSSERTSVVADDAVHGGRRHDLGAAWPRVYSYLGPAGAKAWAVDAGGDVAWTAEGDTGDHLYVWRAGLGRRLVDARADLRSPSLADGLLRWRRNGKLRSVDLATVPGSACPQPARIGTLEVDLLGDHPLESVCLRATGRTEKVGNAYVDHAVIDVNGPYLVINWWYNGFDGSYMSDLLQGTGSALIPGQTLLRSAPVDDAVVDEHGSLAWLDSAGGTRTLWVRDGAGMRTIPGAGTSRSLRRDGSTVTWPGGGPTVTLNP